MLRDKNHTYWCLKILFWGTLTVIEIFVLKENEKWKFIVRHVLERSQ